jgi:hypothetical protein
MEVSGQLQAPAALPLYPLDRTLGGPQSRLDASYHCLGRDLNSDRPAHNLVSRI